MKNYNGIFNKMKIKNICESHLKKRPDVLSQDCWYRDIK